MGCCFSQPTTGMGTDRRCGRRGFCDEQASYFGISRPNRPQAFAADAGQQLIANSLPIGQSSDNVCSETPVFPALSTKHCPCIFAEVEKIAAVFEAFRFHARTSAPCSSVILGDLCGSVVSWSSAQGHNPLCPEIARPRCSGTGFNENRWARWAH